MYNMPSKTSSTIMATSYDALHFHIQGSWDQVTAVLPLHLVWRKCHYQNLHHFSFRFSGNMLCVFWYIYESLLPNSRNLIHDRITITPGVEKMLLQWISLNKFPKRPSNIKFWRRKTSQKGSFQNINKINFYHPWKTNVIKIMILLSVWITRIWNANCLKKNRIQL